VVRAGYLDGHSFFFVRGSVGAGDFANQVFGFLACDLFVFLLVGFFEF